MADPLILVAHNLSAIAGELREYGRALKLVIEETSIDFGADSDTPIIKSYTAGAVASMIIIKACGFYDEVNNYYSRYHRETQTPTIQAAIKELNQLVKTTKIKDLRNYVLAHNNREKDQLLTYNDIIKKQRLYEPEDYYQLIECCKKVAAEVMALI